MTEVALPLPSISISVKDQDVHVEAIEVEEPESRTINTPLMTPPLQDNATNIGDSSPGPKHQAAFVNKLYS